jgi:hypothetical protein
MPTVISFPSAAPEEARVSSLVVDAPVVVPPHPLSEHASAAIARKTARIRFLIADSPSAALPDGVTTKLLLLPLLNCLGYCSASVEKIQPLK